VTFKELPLPAVDIKEVSKSDAPSLIAQLNHFVPAALVLADGTVFHGRSIGAATCKVGEVVFNTALTGYQEIISDPSYAQQLVTLTYPHIGNVGCNSQDDEAARVFASGLIIKDLPIRTSSWRSQRSLPDYLIAHNIPGIADIDTRKLTRLLREKGAQNGCIWVGTEPGQELNIDEALARARGFAGLAGLDLAKEVSTKVAFTWTEGSWALNQGGASSGHTAVAHQPFHVVAFDYGVKRNILRMLADRGCRLTVLPAQASAATALALKPDGIFLSNGPGDPEPCDYAIAATAELIEAGLPTFGICLGHQIMALASGAKTMKMKFGHHGANHPVKDFDTGQVLITSQNHGFAVDESTIGPNLRVTHRSLFDNTVQGLQRTDKLAFCFQGHPEASPGPHDIGYLFDRFIDLMKKTR
jgi:carbamoyl-phosphate synthase small subunit